MAEWHRRTLTGCGLQAQEILSKGAHFNGVLSGFPVFSAPPAAAQPLEGYAVGVFGPEQRAAAYIVVKKKGVVGVIKTHNHDAKYTYTL